jgi:hypothetical protein
LGQHLAPVLRGQDLRELDDARDAEPSVSQGRLHLREALEQVGGGLTVVGGAGGEPHLAVEEIEEAREAESEPELPPVEVGEEEDEIPQGGSLLAEEVLEAEGEVAGGVHGVHANTIARDLEPSWNARIRPWAR